MKMSFGWRESMLTQRRYPMKQDDIDIKATECVRHVHTHLFLSLSSVKYTADAVAAAAQNLITQIPIEREHFIKIDSRTNQEQQQQHKYTLIQTQRLSFFFLSPSNEIFHSCCIAYMAYDFIEVMRSVAC